MSDAIEPPRRSRHVAVRMEHCLLVIGGFIVNGPDGDVHPASQDVIWMNNLYTEQWIKHVTQNWRNVIKIYNKKISTS